MVKIVSKRLIKKISWKLLLGLFLLFSFVSPAGADITVTVVDRNGNPAAENKITWDSASIIPGTTKWLCAKTLLKVECDYTGGAIQIYTDNTAADAIPEWTGSGDPKNLLKDEGATSIVGLPLCWRVWGKLLDDSPDDLIIVQVNGDICSLSSIGWQTWFWMKDRGSDDFIDGDNWITNWKESVGIQVSFWQWVDWWGDTPSPFYIYIGANFTDAMALSTYKTSTLRLELFTL